MSKIIFIESKEGNKKKGRAKEISSSLPKFLIKGNNISKLNPLPGSPEKTLRITKRFWAVWPLTINERFQWLLCLRKFTKNSY